MNRLAAFLFFLLLTGTTAAGEQPLIVVFPLDGSSTNNALQWLSEGVALSISEQLEGRELKALDRNERLNLVENLDLPPGARLSRASMIRVAQRAGADMIVTGTYSGTEQNLRFALRVLNLKTLKLSGEMLANSPIPALQQTENELAWLILTNNGFEKSFTREKFQERTRRVPNQAYSLFVRSLEAPKESDQIQLLQSALQAYRDFPEAQFRLGRAYYQKGDCSSALPHLLQSRSDKNPQVEIDFMRGTCYLQTDQTAQAVQSFYHLLQTARPYEALNNIAVAYLRKGDMNLAANSLVEARNQARSDPTVTMNLALVRHLQGNESAARSLLEEAYRVHPDYGMLQFLLSVVLKAQGESEKAVATSGRARNLGVNVEKMQAEDPVKWSRVLSSLENH